MTQPTPAQPPEDDHTPAILGTAAATLALIAIEARVREDIEDAIDDAVIVLTALIIAALATPAAALIVGGVAFMSRPDVHTALTRTTEAARQKAAVIVRNGYQSAAAVAQQKATKDLAGYRYQVPTQLPPLGDNLNKLLADIDLMFGHAQTDLQTTIATAYDNPDTIRTAIQTAGARLNQRALASAAVAVHTGAYDAQQAIYDDFQLHTGRPNLMKRWRVTSNNPCGMCEALDGTLVGLSSEFDHDATIDDRDMRLPWRNQLQGPPRHPNCRCQIELVQT